jgi:hypothetical protein
LGHPKILPTVTRLGCFAVDVARAIHLLLLPPTMLLLSERRRGERRVGRLALLRDLVEGFVFRQDKNRREKQVVALSILGRLHPTACVLADESGFRVLIWPGGQR